MDHQNETAPASGTDPGMEALAQRIGSAHNDLDRFGSGDAATGAIAALPPEVQEIALQHRAGRPIAARRAESNEATPEDWSELFDRLKAERAQDWRSTVPREFAAAATQLLAADQQPEAIRQWWASDRTILVLRSERPGNGKTYAAFAVANRVCDQVWCVAYQLSDLVRDQIGRDPDPRVWNRATRCELLILDDVGQEAGSGVAVGVSSWKRDEARDVLHRLLSIRNGAGLRTILTTNRDGDWLDSGYGSAVLDRMGQNAEVIEFTGESRRADAAPQWGEL